MHPILILSVGFFCTLLCTIFYSIHFIEIRRINKEYEKREREKINNQTARTTQGSIKGTLIGEAANS